MEGIFREVHSWDSFESPLLLCSLIGTVLQFWHRCTSIFTIFAEEPGGGCWAEAGVSCETGTIGRVLRWDGRPLYPGPGPSLQLPGGGLQTEPGAACSIQAVRQLPRSRPQTRVWTKLCPLIEKHFIPYFTTLLFILILYSLWGIGNH